MEEEFKRYKKIPIAISAKKMEKPFKIKSMEGIVKGKAGDYHMIGVEGEHYICDARIFKKTYKEVDSFVFLNVDTQKDFMNKDGALYIPNVETIKPNLVKLTNFAKNNCIQVIATMDSHYGTEKYKDIETELQKWGGPFPNHCMVGSPGWNQIDETKVDGTIFIEKQNYDMFSNPKTEKIFDKTDRETIVIYGVATDYCIKAAVLGLLKLKYKTIVIEDAIMGVDKKTTKEALKGMESKGAIFKKTEDVLNGYI